MTNQQPMMFVQEPKKVDYMALANALMGSSAHPVRSIPEGIGQAVKTLGGAWLAKTEQDNKAEAQQNRADAVRSAIDTAKLSNDPSAGHPGVGWGNAPKGIDAMVDALMNNPHTQATGINMQMNRMLGKEQSEEAAKRAMADRLAGIEDYETKKSIDQKFAPKPDRKVIKGADGYSYYQDDNSRVLPGVQKTPDINRATRNLSMPDEFIQPQESLDGGKSWRNVGEPYSRREPYVVQEVRQADGTIQRIAVPRSEINKRVQEGDGVNPVVLSEQAPKPVKPSDAQVQAATFARRIADAHNTIGLFESVGSETTGGLNAMLPNALKSTERQQIEQAQRNFVTALLRKESGAAINKDEFATAALQYFPQPGDGPEVLKQKQANRQRAIDGMIQAAGPAWSPEPEKLATGTDFSSLSDDDFAAELQKRGLNVRPKNPMAGKGAPVHENR